MVEVYRKGDFKKAERRKIARPQYRRAVGRGSLTREVDLRIWFFGGPIL